MNPSGHFVLCAECALRLLATGRLGRERCDGARARARAAPSSAASAGPSRGVGPHAVVNWPAFLRPRGPTPAARAAHAMRRGCLAPGLMICCLVRVSPNTPPGALEAIGRACSPRVESHGPSVVMFDADGLGRVVGSPADIAREVTQLAVRQGLAIRVALAPTSTAAWLLAHAATGAATVVVRPDDAATALSALPLRWLATLPDWWIFQAQGPRPGTGHKRHWALGTWHVRTSKFGASRPSSRHYRMAPGPVAGPSSTPRGSIGGRSSRRADNAQAAVFDLLATLERWGLRTLGDVARLPRADVHARLGAPGVRLHQAARGEETAWLVPADDAPRFVERCVLDWPIEGLEPLSFVLARVLDPFRSRSSAPIAARSR